METVVSSRGIRTRADLITRDYERLFRSRVPLPPQALEKIEVTDPWSYAELGEAVEAWGFRYMQSEGRFVDRAEVARRWFAQEYTPVLRMLRSVAGLDQVLCGSDYPYFRRDLAVGCIAALMHSEELAANEREAVMGANALKLFPRLARLASG